MGEVRNEQNIASIDASGLRFNYMESVDSYQIDFDKAKTVEDCFLLMKCFINGCNSGYEPTITIYNNSPYYGQMKHLKKD